MNTTLLRRNRSDPILASSTSSRGSGSIIVDLARMETLPALKALRNTPDLRQNITSASVNADSCVWYGEVQLVRVALIEAFRLLGELPRLERVTVDLSDLKIPVAALTELLKGTKVLKELHFMNVQLMGPTEALEKVLQAHKQLVHVRFMRCGGAAIQSFMIHLPALKKLELRYTTVGRVSKSCRDPWVVLGLSTTLQSLTVQELTDLQTEHALAFVSALTEQQLRQTSQLMELHITSDSTSGVNGQAIGEAVADLFMLYPLNTIKTLSLKLGKTWETAGATVASILQLNPRINSLCVDLTGKEATAVQAMAIFRALQNNSYVRRLKLCLDRDMDLDEPLEVSFHHALHNLLLEHNHVLQSVTVLDENRDRYPLGAAIQHKLKLNASKVPALLHCTTATKNAQQHHRDYINAMIDSKDSHDVLFYAISNQPSLLLDARLSEKPICKNSLIDTDSASDDDSTSCGGNTSIKRKSAVTSAKQKILEMFSL
jgi:hypothetical protein